MVQFVRGISEPFSNDNVDNIFCAVTLDNTNENYISILGGAEPNFPSDSGEIIQLVSESVNDTSQVRIIGLDKDFLFQKETLTLNGTTPVQTTKEFTRINDLTWFGTEKLQGLIKAQNLAGTVDYRSISVESQISEDGVFSVAAGKKWYVPLLYSSIVRDAMFATTGCSVNLYFRPVGFSFQRPFRLSLSAGGSTSYTYENLYPTVFKGASDFYLTATATDPNTDVIARLSIVSRQL